MHWLRRGRDFCQKSGDAPSVRLPRGHDSPLRYIAGTAGQVRPDRRELPITSPELIAILAVGVSFAGLIVAGQRSLNARIDKLERRIDALERCLTALEQRFAHLEGMLEGLREAIAGRRADAAE
ncbi:MAG: hypothetical protein J4F33_06475 [Alphaproteobacteria bacterium]|nr:hypothetical protein [Alphaproteobacteria bacterium]